MYEENHFNEHHQPETQLAKIENENQENEIQVNTLPGQEVLLSVRGYLSEKTQNYLSSDINRLNEQNHNSIIELKNRGELSLEMSHKCESLMLARRIDADSLTIEQVNRVHAYVLESVGQDSEVLFEKGARLYSWINAAIGRQMWHSKNSYSRNKQRRFDEVPDFGDYEDADDFDRASDRLSRQWYAGLNDRYFERSCAFDNSTEVKPNRQIDKYRNQDEFSRKIGQITTQHLENVENGGTISEDESDLMFGKDLRFSLGEVERSEDESSEFNGDLIYGIFTESDMDKVEEIVPLRRDLSKDSNSLHVAKILDVFTSGKITDVIDQLDVECIERVNGENRLTAKSVVALGVGTLEHFMSVKEKYNINSAKMHGLARKVEVLCKDLLNISESHDDKKENDKYEDIKDKLEKRKSSVWIQVNRGIDNLSKIDDLIQYSQELVVLLEIQNNESEFSLNDGNNIQST